MLDDLIRAAEDKLRQLEDEVERAQKALAVLKQEKLEGGRGAPPGFQLVSGMGDSTFERVPEALPGALERRSSSPPLRAPGQRRVFASALNPGDPLPDHVRWVSDEMKDAVLEAIRQNQPVLYADLKNALKGRVGAGTISSALCHLRVEGKIRPDTTASRHGVRWLERTSNTADAPGAFFQ